MSDEQSRPDTVYIIYSIFNSFDVLNRYIRNKLWEHHISPIRVSLFGQLKKHGGSMTLTELSKSLFRSQNGISQLVSRLERQGLVRRGENTSDARSRLVLLTDAGKNTIENLGDHIKEICLTALNSLSNEEMETLRVLLKQVREDLNQHVGTPSMWQQTRKLSSSRSRRRKRLI